MPTAVRMAKSSSTPEPPPGSPWDDALETAPFAFVDLEMSGLDVSRDRVIQVCIERVVGREVQQRLSTFIRPEPACAIPDTVHGISPAMLLDAPTFAQVAQDICDLLGGAVLVAHAARYDIAFLAAEMKRAGIAWTPPAQFVDTLALSRRAFSFPSHRLVALCREFEIPHDNPHRADEDVRAMREVFGRVVTELEATTPRDLWHVKIGVGHARPEILAAATRAAAGDFPVSIRYRPSGKPARVLVFRVTEVRPELDPPLVLGYLHHSRGRRQLRADRILAIDEHPTD